MGGISSTGGSGGGGAALSIGVFPNDPIHNYKPSIAVDGTGRIHVAMVGNGDAIYYSTCASGCDLPSSWSTVSVAPIGITSTQTQIQVDAAGRPRILFYYDGNSSGSREYRYAACDSNCTVATSWTAVTAATFYGEGRDDEIRSFALDAQGHPGFVRVESYGSTPGLYYDRCVAASCTSPTNWTETLIFAPSDGPQWYSGETLAYDADGVAHLAMRGRIADNEFRIEYLRCASGCDLDANWVWTVLPYSSGFTSEVQLRLDPLKRPRIAYFSEYDGVPTSTVVYASCNSTCTDPANWSAITVGTLANDGKLGLDLALDSSGRPRIAYNKDSSPDGAGLAACDTACESAGSTWVTATAESTAQLDAVAPIPAISGCTSAWTSAAEERLALGPAGQVCIAYTATHQQGVTCTLYTDKQRVRVLVP